MTKAQLLQLYAERYPEDKEGSRAVWASQFLRFISELPVGDTVVTYDPDRRSYLLGVLGSQYEWAPGTVPAKPHVRRVEWAYEIPRAAIGVAVT